MNITFEGLALLGAFVKRELTSFINDRCLLEQQWLKNLRQYHGQYDPEVTTLIPAERSHAYPRDTRVKVKGGVAKLMEMMFPSQERNWELAISPTPSVPQEALQAIIDDLSQQELMAAQQEQRQPAPLGTEAIERAVRAFAEKRKDAMEQEIDDQLSDPEIDYPQLCKKVVRNGYIFGFGISCCPHVRTQTERLWEPDEFGSYQAVEKKIRRPYPEYRRIWDIYPDLSAKSWTDQDRIFDRVVLTRHDFGALAKRPDFKADAIKQYLRDNPNGNFKEQSYEADLHQLAGSSNITDRQRRRYEVYRMLGFVSAHELQAAGVEVKDSELDQEILADVWIIDNVVIKADKSAFGERPSDQYHAFIYAEDEDSGLTGIGLPEEVRDSQMCLCASSRALMDNMAATAGPILEINVDLLPKGRRSIGSIRPFMTIEREGLGNEANYPAVRDIATQSHVNEILAIIAAQRQQLDIESNLPAFTMGGTQQPLGEAFRTSNNMSMMMGGANMVTKDTVRGFDKFTASLIGSLLTWNMEFNPKQEIKGDYQARGKGTISLVAKEVRGAALDQFVMTLTPEERAILDTYGILIDRLKSRDLPVDRVLPREEAMAALEGMRQAASQAGQIEQGLTQAKTDKTTADAEKSRMAAQVLSASAEATIQEILSRVEQNLANAKSSADKNQLESLKMMLSAATDKGGKREQGEGGADRSAVGAVPAAAGAATGL
jgi:hypothetical protein